VAKLPSIVPVTKLVTRGPVASWFSSETEHERIILSRKSYSLRELGN